MLEEIIIVLHVLVALSILGLVLMQQGKGSDIGAAFGSGASNTMFGSSGSASFLVKLTATLAVIFFCTSIALNYFGAHEAHKPQKSLLNLSASQPQMVMPKKAVPQTTSVTPVSSHHAVSSHTILQQSVTVKK